MNDESNPLSKTERAATEAVGEVRRSLRDTLSVELEGAPHSVVVAHDDHPLWVSIRDALDWLYRLDQLHAARPGYFEDRNRRADGRTLAGLMFARGLVSHGTAEVHDLFMNPATMWIKIVTKDGAEKVWKHEGPLYVNIDGQPQRAIVRAADAVWADRSKLPPPGLPERHGKDEMYEEQVASKKIMEPLQLALGFLLSLR